MKKGNTEASESIPKVYHYSSMGSGQFALLCKVVSCSVLSRPMRKAYTLNAVHLHPTNKTLPSCILLDAPTCATVRVHYKP